MPRRNRVHYPGAQYHVICRGNNKSYIFDTPHAKTYYLQLIEKYQIENQFKVHAYVIMSNHVHLLIEVGEIPLSKIMQCIQASYTFAYNKYYSRTGHCFEQRYKAFVIEGELDKERVIRYIHQNPVRAHLKGGLLYPWSSLIGITKRFSNLIDIDEELSVLLADNRVCNGDRIIRHILTPDIEEPGNSVQHRNDVELNILLSHFLSQSLDLALRSLTRKIQAL